MRYLFFAYLENAEEAQYSRIRECGRVIGQWRFCSARLPSPLFGRGRFPGALLFDLATGAPIAPDRSYRMAMPLGPSRELIDRLGAG